MPIFVPVAGARSETRVSQNAKDIDLNDSDFKRDQFDSEYSPTAGPRTLPPAAELNEYWRYS